MNKKSLYILLLTIVFLMLGFGCKGLSEEEKSAVQPVALDYWTIHNDVEQLQKFAQEYKKIRPYVTVNIRQVRYEEFDNLFTNALADDVEPDIVSMHTRWLSKYTGRLSVMPESVRVSRIFLKNQFNKEIEVVEEINQMPSLRSVKSAYVKTVADDIMVGDSIYGLPLAVDTLAIYYNRDLLDKSGIPEPPSTWDEFVEAVGKTTKFDSDGKIIQSGAALGTGENIENSFDILSLFMMQNGVEMASGRSVNFAGGLKDAGKDHPALQALRFYTDFANPAKESYCWNDKMDTAMNSFVRGKTVFYFGYGYDRGRIQSRAPGMNLGVIQVPQLNQTSPSNVANYWIESVVKRSKYKNEAWDFVRFIASPEKVAEYVKKTGQPSPLRTQINSQMADENLAPFASQVLFAENWYNGNSIDEADKAFKDLITSYLKIYDSTEDPLKQASGLLNNAASIIQQGM